MEELLAPVLNSTGGAISDSKLRMLLSTPDLNYVLETVHVKAEEIKNRIYNTVQSHHADFLELVTNASEAAVHTEELFRLFQDVLDNSAPRKDARTGLSYESRIWNLSAEVQKLRKDLSVKQHALSLVNLTVAIRDDILAAKATFQKGQIVQGATKLAELKDRLKHSEKDFTESHFYRLLEKLLAEVSSEVEATVEKLFLEAVALDVDKQKLTIVKVEFAGGKLDAVALFQAMNAFGILDTCLSRFVDALRKSLPVIVNSSVTVHKDSEQAVLSWANVGDVKPMQSPKEAYDRVLLFVKFMHEHIANRQQEWMRKLGRLMWPKLADLLIEGCLRKVVPLDPKHFEEFQKVQQLTTEFENALQEQDFIVLKANGGKLSRFASEMEAHFASKKKNQVLSRARQLIVQFDYNLFLRNLGNFEDKTEFLFQRHDYPVSYLPKQLLFIVHEVLKDACSCPRRIAYELFQTARDAVLLFRAVVTSTQAEKLVLQAALVCHNDCLYMAHELLAIAYEYNSSLPAGLEKTCTFVDIVPLFLALGEKVLSEQLRRVKSSLSEKLDSADGFRHTDARRQREAVEQALEEVILVLESAKMESDDILPKTAREKLLLDLTNFVMQRITDDVLSLGDMSADETTQLHNLLECFNEKLVWTVRTSSLDFSQETSWRKLKCLAAILEMPLRSITRAWEDGELKNAGFSAAEVRNLIKVIFTHTSLRAECLERIL